VSGVKWHGTCFESIVQPFSSNFVAQGLFHEHVLLILSIDVVALN